MSVIYDDNLKSTADSLIGVTHDVKTIDLTIFFQTLKITGLESLNNDVNSVQDSNSFNECVVYGRT